MRKTTLRHAVSALVAVSVLAWLAGSAQAQFVLYDNFASGVIDPSRWEGTSAEGTFGAPTAEFIRAADTGALRLALVSWGNDSSNTGSTTSRQGLQFKQLGTLGGSGSIIGVKVKVTVLNAVVEDCVANAGTGASIRARAQFNGWFFNDGSSTGPTDDTGNIIAGIQVTKEANGSNQIQAFMQRCTNASCSTVETPAGITPPTLTTSWSPNTPVVLKVRWDRVNGKFKFAVTDPTTFETAQIVYQGIVTDAGAPANGDFKQIRVHNNVKNCSTGRKQVVMDALFDNISVERAP